MCSEKTQIRSQSYDRAYFANDATEMRSVCAEWRWSDAYFNPTITADSLCRPHGASCGQHQLNNMLTTLPVIVLSFQIFVSWIHFQHETSCVCCNQILRQWLKIRRKKKICSEIGWLLKICVCVPSKCLLYIYSIKWSSSLCFESRVVSIHSTCNGFSQETKQHIHLSRGSFHSWHSLQIWQKCDGKCAHIYQWNVVFILINFFLKAICECDRCGVGSYS